jgi:hypothetical protein
MVMNQQRLKNTGVRLPSVAMYKHNVIPQRSRQAVATHGIIANAAYI